MKSKGLNNIIPNKIFWVVLVLGVIFTQCLNLIVNKMQLFGVQNIHPFSLPVDRNVLLIAFGVAFGTAFVTKLINKYPLAFGIVGVGVLSNLIEKTLYGYVTDYIKISWGYINAADLILWFGLILLNYEVWFNDFKFEPSHSFEQQSKPENKTEIQTQPITEIDKVLEETPILETKAKLQKLLPKINKIKTVSDQFQKPESETAIPKIPEDQINKQSLRPKIKVNS